MTDEMDQKVTYIEMSDLKQDELGIPGLENGFEKT